MKTLFTSIIALAAAATAMAQTNVLVVEQTNGTSTAIPTSMIGGIFFEEAPEYTPAPYAGNATYGEKGDMGFYTLNLYTALPNDNGMMATAGDVQLQLVLCAAKSADMYAPIIPAGYYTQGSSSTPFSLDISASTVWLCTEDNSEGGMDMIVSGSVDVRTTDGSDYDIRVELQSIGGNEYNIRYRGPLKFVLDATTYEPISEDLSTDFTNGQGRFYGNWFNHFTSDMTMQFFDGEWDGNTQTQGFFLQVALQMPKVDNPMNPVQVTADGTYIIDPREKVDYSAYYPMTFTRGDYFEMWGIGFYTGTYFTYIAENGHRYLGLITDGTITVSENGTKFVFDLTTDTGHKFTATYSKKPIIQNFCDNNQTEILRPYTTLTENHVINNFTDDHIAFAYNEGNTVNPFLNTWVLAVTDINMVKGDYLQFYILSDNANELADGTYQVNMSERSGTVVSGCVDYGGGMLYSWYGDLDTTDEEGVQSVLAPIYSGTLTIATNANGTRTFTFNFNDDKYNTLTGEWTGLYYDFTDDLNGAATYQHRMNKRASRANFRR